MKKSTSYLKFFLFFAAVGGSLLFSGCGPKTQPLVEVVFSSDPLKQVQLQAATFKQLSTEDLDLLMAYLGANEKAKLEKSSFSNLEGKSLLQVIDESRTWRISMVEFLDKSNKISLQLGQMVSVVPMTKTIRDDQSIAGKSQVLQMSYLLVNKTDRVVTGVAGVVKYMWPDKRVAATISLTFDSPMNPGEALKLSGHDPILVGSRADKEMAMFAKTPLDSLLSEVFIQAIRYQGGEIISIPVL